MSEENGSQMANEENEVNEEAPDQPMEEIMADPATESEPAAVDDDAQMSETELAASDQEAPEKEEESASEQAEETEPITEEPVLAESLETSLEQEEIPSEQAKETEPETEPVVEEPATLEAPEDSPEQEEPSAEPVKEEQAVEETPPVKQSSEAASENEDEKAEGLAPAPEPIPDDGRLWYVLHCYSGYENKVRHNLEQRIDSMGMKDMIFERDHMKRLTPGEGYVMQPGRVRWPT